MKLKRFGALGLIGLALVACATVEAPKGGPEDKIPPHVVAVYPTPRATVQPTKLDVRIQFSEWIMNPVPRNALRISPPLENPLQTEVDGDLLILTSKASLDTLTTYTVSLTNALNDLHNNAIAHPFQLVFSTGPQVDTLQVRGLVNLPDSLRKKKLIPTIGLYPIGFEARAQRNYLKKLRDTANPSADSIPYLLHEPLLFLAQTDTLGQFHMEGVAPGHYRIAAFLDLNGNNRIDPSTELAGVGEQDIVLDQNFHDTLFLNVINQDTSQARLTSVRIATPWHATLEFSHNPPKDSLRYCNLLHKDSSLAYAPALAWITDPQHVTLFFDTIPSRDSTYLIGCGHRQRMQTRWIPALDSLPTTRQVSMRVLGPLPSPDSLPLVEITYNLPVIADTIAPHLHFINGKDTLATSVQQNDPIRILVKPAKPLTMGITYKLTQLDPDTTDTIPKFHATSIASVETASPLKITRLQGKINGCEAQSRVRLRSAQGYISLTNCDPTGHFRMDGLLEGSYTLDVFDDQNSDSIPDAGTLSPYHPAGVWRPLSDSLHLGSDLSQAHLDSLLTKLQLPQRTHQ